MGLRARQKSPASEEAGLQQMPAAMNAGYDERLLQRMRTGGVAAVARVFRPGDFMWLGLPFWG